MRPHGRTCSPMIQFVVLICSLCMNSSVASPIQFTSASSLPIHTFSNRNITYGTSHNQSIVHYNYSSHVPREATFPTQIKPSHVVTSIIPDRSLHNQTQSSLKLSENYPGSLSSKPNRNNLELSSTITKTMTNRGVQDNRHHVIKDQDQFVDGSGMGPLNSQKHKHDDSEDAEDDDDEDYADTVDSGSGYAKESYKPNLHSTELVSQAPVRKPDNDIYNPFRPPSIGPSIYRPGSSYEAPKLTSQLPVSIDITSTTARMKINMTTTVTTPAPSTKPSASSARVPLSSPNSVSKIKNNQTKHDSEYDYEEESEDDDSEETSAFEDNDFNEFDAVNKTSANNLGGNILSHDKGLPSTIPSLVNQSIPTANRPPGDVEFNIHKQNNLSNADIFDSANSQVSRNTTNAAYYPVDPAAVNASDHNSESDSNEDTAEGEEEDDEEENLDVEDEEDSTNDDEGLHKNDRFLTNSSYNDKTKSDSTPATTSSMMPNLVPTKEPNSFSPAFETTVTTLVPINTTERQSVNSMQNNQIGSSTPYAIYIHTTTPVPILKRPMISINNPSFSTDVPIYHAKPTTMSANPSTTLNANVYHRHHLAPNLASTTPIIPNYVSIVPPTEKPVYTYEYSTKPTVQSIPATTTHLLPDDRHIPDVMHDDGLTRQIYDKTLEVYQGTERALKRVWDAVWPPNLDFDNLSFEPLLAQPLFFMFALAGAVIGLVLLMMLVVYIITYQIQPRDNDDISLY